MHMAELIEKKRDGGELSTAEINFIIRGYTEGTIPDYQMSALCMAIYYRGMTDEETTAMTMAMAHSGEMVDLSPLGEYTGDKHSTGGVGDKTSLVLCPMVACCGLKMAKMSGRGLGHTGGTLDKLESIPGLSVEMNGEKFFDIANRIGFVLAGQSAEMAPADKKLYALRDVTATVPSRPLIVSSIMSKKLASGASTIVLDVKTGSGAFMETEEDSFALAQDMVDVGRLAGRNIAAVVTDMDQPLGYAVGNALEVEEAISLLKGADVPDLKELCLTIGTQLLLRSGLHTEEAAARRELEAVLHTGAALDCLAAMVEAQGGDKRAIYDPSLLPKAPVRYELKSDKRGFVSAIQTKVVGEAAMHLGAGRETAEGSIDPAVGIVLHKKLGDAVRPNETIAVLHARAEDESLRAAARELLSAFTISREKPLLKPFIRGIVE